MRQREEAGGEDGRRERGTVMGGRVRERERGEETRPPSTTTYLHHGIVSSPHSSRCSTLPPLAANHHYLITRPFFVGRRRSVGGSWRHVRGHRRGQRRRFS